MANDDVDNFLKFGDSISLQTTNGLAYCSLQRCALKKSDGDDFVGKAVIFFFFLIFFKQLIDFFSDLPSFTKIIL